MLSTDPALSASSELSGRSSFSSSLKIINDNVETTGKGFEESEVSKTESMDVQIIVEFLRRAGIQLSDSYDVDQRSKNILNALIKIVIKDLYNLPEEKEDQVSELVSAKVRIGFISFLMWIILVLVILLSNSAARRSTFLGMPPT